MMFFKKVAIFFVKFIFIVFCFLVAINITVEILKPTYTPENDPHLPKTPVAILYREHDNTEQKFAIIYYGDIASTTSKYAEYTFFIPHDQEEDLNKKTDLIDQSHTGDFTSTDTPWDSGFRIQNDGKEQSVYVWYDFDSDWSNNALYKVNKEGIQLIEHQIFFGPGLAFASLPAGVLGIIIGFLIMYVSKKIRNKFISNIP